MAKPILAELQPLPPANEKGKPKKYIVKITNYTGDTIKRGWISIGNLQYWAKTADYQGFWQADPMGLVNDGEISLEILNRNKQPEIWDDLKGGHYIAFEFQTSAMAYFGVKKIDSSVEEFNPGSNTATLHLKLDEDSQQSSTGQNDQP